MSYTVHPKVPKQQLVDKSKVGGIVSESSRHNGKRPPF